MENEETEKSASGSVNFGGDNNVSGNARQTMTGDVSGDSVSDGSIKGDGGTVINTGTEGEGITWADVQAEIPTDDLQSRSSMDALKKYSTLEAIDDSTEGDIDEELSFLKGTAPGALRMAADVIKRGKAGGAARIMELLAGWLETPAGGGNENQS